MGLSAVYCPFYLASPKCFFAALAVFRHDPAIKLGGVPDLMRWTADGPTAKLGTALEKAASPQEAVAVVAKFLLDTQ